jgi:FkbM family methyltransferase
MKQIAGIWLPMGDTHFGEHLENSERVNGGGTYQLAKIRMALDLAPDRRGLALDVGAHVGLWSRILVREFKTVYAFEPMPTFAACFRRNVPTVLLREMAVGDWNGDVELVYTHDNTGNTHVRGNGETALTVKAPIVRLDDLGLPAVDLIKVDVEGFETAVIRGAEYLIKRDKPAVVVECKPNGNAERYGYGETEAVNLLRSWGMTLAGKKSGDYFLRF